MKSSPYSPPPRPNAPPAGRPLAASYARKSDKNDFGVERQHDLHAARAQDDGYDIPDDESCRFGDDNTKGTTTSRRGLDRLIALVESGEAPFRRLYVKDKTRLGRFDDPRYHHYLEVHFEKFGVTVCYWEKKKSQADLADPKNPDRFGTYLQDAVGSIMASDERRRLISRVTGGMRDRVRLGYFPGAQAAYGLVRWLADSKTGALIEPVPPNTRLRRAGCFFRLAWAQDGTTSVIQRIFRELEAGVSLRGVARALAADRLASPGGLRAGGGGEGAWTSEAVRRVARNPIYCGDLVWGRTTRTDFGPPLPVNESTAGGDPAIFFPGFIAGEAPVSRAQWEAVQAVLDGNVGSAASRRASRPEYLLSGLVRCGHCGAAFHGHSPSTKRTTTRYYRHDWRRQGERGPCPHENRYIDAEILEQSALRQLHAVLAGGGLITAVHDELARRRAAHRSGRHEQQVRDLERQLARHRAALDNATHEKAFASNAAERASYDSAIKRISAEVLAYERQVAEAQRDTELLSQVEARVGRLESWTPDRLEEALASSPVDRKRALSMLVERVLIWPERHEAELRIRPAA